MTPRKNLDLEFLRAMAILMTVFQHAEVLVFWPGSWHQRLRHSVGLWTGVDLFFCISGYIITHTLLVGLREDRLRHLKLGFDLTPRHVATAFWIKRIWRLWPAAWCAVIVTMLCTAFLNRSGIFGDPWRMARDALAALFHVANFHWAGCYHGNLQNCNMVERAQVPLDFPTGWALVVYWSLSLEEQFYLVAPLMIALIPRRGLIWLLVLAWLLLASTRRPPLEIAWFFRIDAMVLGVLLAFLRDRHPNPPVGLVRAWESWGARVGIWVLVAAGFLILALLGAANPAAWPGTVSLISLAAALLVWIASFDRRVLMPRGVVGSVMTWFGSRAYSLYLYHMVAYLATREVWWRFGLATNESRVSYLLSGIVLMLCMAEASYRWVEQPARQHGYRVAARYSQRHAYDSAGDTGKRA